jgi:hypothetical protein
MHIHVFIYHLAFFLLPLVDYAQRKKRSRKPKNSSIEIYLFIYPIIFLLYQFQALQCAK